MSSNIVRVTSDNASDVFGDGQVSYDASTNTLKLNNFVREDVSPAPKTGANPNGGAIFSTNPNGLNIHLKGTNEINQEGANASSVISVVGNLTITGDKDATLTGYSNPSSDTGSGSVGITCKKLFMKSGTVVTRAERGLGGYSESNTYGDLEMTGGILTFDAGGGDGLVIPNKNRTWTITGGTLNLYATHNYAQIGPYGWQDTLNLSVGEKYGVFTSSERNRTTPPTLSEMTQIDVTDKAKLARGADSYPNHYIVFKELGPITLTATNYNKPYDGEAHGITVTPTDPTDATIKYSETEGSYAENPVTYTNVTNGDKTVYYEASAVGYETKKGSATVTITKATPTVEAPVAKNPSYTGEELALVDPATLKGAKDETGDTVGQVLYAVTDTNTAPADSAYSGDIPKKKEQGTYYVWYKVTGTSNYNDVATSIEAKIDKTIDEKVKDMIDALPEPSAVTTDDADAINAAKEAYESLDETQKASVGEDRKKKLDDDVKALADQEAAAEVIAKINVLPKPSDVTTENKEAIDEAKAAYDALSDEQKAIVDKNAEGATKQKLDDDVLALAKAEALDELSNHRESKDDEAYDEDGVAAMDNALEEGQEAINEAKTPEEVKNALDDAKKAIDDVKTIEQKEDQAAADEVIEKIDNLPPANKITPADKKAIEDAREAYNGLTDNQKKLVSNYNKLTDAEAALKAAESSKVLVAKAIASGKKAVNLTWNNVDADRYTIYMAKCKSKGKTYGFKKIKTVNGKTLKMKKGKLSRKTAYKFYVVAEKNIGGSFKTVAVSKKMHVFTGNRKGKYTNPKSLKLKKAAINLNAGGSSTIKGTVTKVKKGRKLATTHAKNLRFISNNPTVASVDANGKVTGNNKGVAIVYVQTINGIWKTCKVTVN